MINGKFNTPPDLSEALRYVTDDASARLRVALPGEIITYDKGKRTAEILLGYNRVYNDGTVKPIKAPLVDVPVFTLQGGGVHIGMPIEKGNECLVIFSDINIDAWHKFGGQQTPLDQRRHDISDGFAIVGLNSLAKQISTALGDTEGGIATEFAKIAINKTTDKIILENASQNLLINLTTLLTTLTTLNTAIAGESTIPTAAAAATAANVSIAALQLQLNALLE